MANIVLVQIYLQKCRVRCKCICEAFCTSRSPILLSYKNTTCSVEFVASVFVRHHARDPQSIPICLVYRFIIALIACAIIQCACRRSGVTSEPHESCLNSSRCAERRKTGLKSCDRIKRICETGGERVRLWALKELVCKGPPSHAGQMHHKHRQSIYYPPSELSFPSIDEDLSYAHTAPRQSFLCYV